MDEIPFDIIRMFFWWRRWQWMNINTRFQSSCHLSSRTNCRLKKEWKGRVKDELGRIHVFASNCFEVQGWSVFFAVKRWLKRKKLQTSLGFSSPWTKVSNEDFEKYFKSLCGRVKSWSLASLKTDLFMLFHSIRIEFSSTLTVKMFKKFIAQKQNLQGTKSKSSEGSTSKLIDFY